MGKYKFLMNTRGYCFLCLSKETATYEIETAISSTRKGKRNEPKIFSFQNICKHLKTNLRGVFGTTVPATSSTMPILEQSEMKGTLCKDCAQRHELISEHLLQLEVIKMKLQFCLKSMCERMRNVEKYNEDIMKEFKEEMLSEPETMLHYGIVERLRKRTIEGCSKVTKDLLPRVVLKKVDRPDPSSIETEAEPEPTTNIALSPAPEVFMSPIITSVQGSYANSTILTYSQPPSPSPGPEVDREVDVKYNVVETRAAIYVSSKLVETENNNALTEELPVVDQPPSPLGMDEKVTNQDALPGTISKVKKQKRYVKIPETGKLRCNLCSKEYAHHSAFRIHYRGSHLKIRYECGLCGSKFNYRTGLNRHHQNAHLKVRFKCQVCGAVFTQKDNLDQHKQTAHFGRRYSCKVCSKTFSQPSSRNSHMRRHVIFKDGSRVRIS